MIAWEGIVECEICEFVGFACAEMEEGLEEPILPIECPGCDNMTAHPMDEDELEYEGDDDEDDEEDFEEDFEEEEDLA